MADGINFVVLYLGALKTIYDAVSGLMLALRGSEYRLFALVFKMITTGYIREIFKMTLVRVSQISL